MSTQNHSSSSQQDHLYNEEIDLSFFIRLIKVHKLFITITVLLCLLVSGLYLATRPAIYESTALIKVTGDSGSSSNLSAMLGMTGGAATSGSLASAAPADVETSLIESDYIMNEVAKRLEPNIIKTQPLSDVTRNLLNHLTVKEQGIKTGILKLSYQSRDPERSQKILNTILDVAVEKNIAEKAEETSKTLAFLQQQLPSVTKELDTAENSLNIYRSKTGALDNTVEAQILLQEVANIEKSIDDLNLKKAEMQENFTAKHPYILAINQKEKQLEKKLMQIKVKLKEIPLSSQQTMNLERDIKVHGEIYSNVMQNMQQMQMLKGSTVSSVRILETASYPVIPIHPKTLIILSFSAILGFSFAFFFVLLHSALMRAVNDPLEIEKELRLPALAIVPFSLSQRKLAKEAMAGREEKPYLLVEEKPKDIAIEALRSLRTSLKLSSLGKEQKLISISGCSPGVGKSFVSTNLAIVFADLEIKVLLIDADLRKGHLCYFTGKQRIPGLSEYLQTDITIANITQSLKLNVDFIATGHYPAQPAELLMINKFTQLIQHARENYDLIIVDTPPILAVTDAAIIAQHCDINLLVIGSGKDQMREVRHAKSIFEKASINLNGFILNNLSIDKHGYGGYYNYNYEK